METKLLDDGELALFRRYLAMTADVVGAIRGRLATEFPDELAAVNAALAGGATFAIVTRAGPPGSVALAVTGTGEGGQEVTIEAFRWSSIDVPACVN